MKQKRHLSLYPAEANNILSAYNCTDRVFVYMGVYFTYHPERNSESRVRYRAFFKVRRYFKVRGMTVHTVHLQVDSSNQQWSWFDTRTLGAMTNVLARNINRTQHAGIRDNSDLLPHMEFISILVQEVRTFKLSLIFRCFFCTFWQNINQWYLRHKPMSLRRSHALISIHWNQTSAATAAIDSRNQSSIGCTNLKHSFLAAMMW